MTSRLFRLLTALLFLGTVFLPVRPLRAQDDPVTPLPPSLRLSEVLPDPGVDQEEFIEIHNMGAVSHSLAGFWLRVVTTSSGTEYLVDLSCGQLGADEFLAITDNDDAAVCPLAGFSLANAGATITLEYQLADGAFLVVDGVTYDKALKGESWSLVDNEWLPAGPTPGVVNQAPELEVPPVTCDLDTVFLSEILSNPAGLEADGGEFIELFNAGAEPVSLENCSLSTDKLSSYSFSADDKLEPGGYLVVPLTDKLLNGNGQVALLTSVDEIVEYPSLGDDIAYALIDGQWQITSVPTPGAANLPSPAEPETADEEGPAPCPPGKYRNPETNRCRNIETAAANLTPCRAGQERNPETNRCRTIATATASLTPCREGYERNPETNRCRKVTAANTELAPCDEGYERNPETNRCRRITAVAGASTAPPDTDSSAAPLNNGIFILAAVFAIGYGAFEYRHDLANRLSGLRARFQNHA